MLLCSLNTPSVRNKTADVLDYVSDWLELIGYIYGKLDRVRMMRQLKWNFVQMDTSWMDQCRNRLLEGRTGLMFRDSFHVKEAGGGKHESLKFSEWIPVIIYCPPYSEAHRVTSNTFCMEIARYMESILLTKEKLTITRDIIRYNIHHCCQINQLHLFACH